MEQVNVDKKDIAAVIGKGGATIREIVEKSGAKVDVNDEGVVTVAAPDEESRNIAMQMIKDITAKAFAVMSLIICIAIFLDSSSGAATVTTPSSFTSTFAPDFSTISLIVAPPFPMTAAMSFLSTLTCSILECVFQHQILKLIMLYSFLPRYELFHL